MPDYKQSAIAGTAWQRCHHVALDNPREGTPSIRFHEQEVLSIGGREIQSMTGSVSLAFDPARPIALRDPATGELTGEMSSYGAAYVLIYSAYIDAAEARDALATPTL